MNKCLILCLIALILSTGCVSKRLALRQPNDIPKTDIALAEASAAVVLIICTSTTYTPIRYSEASNGFIISKDGYIITVSHGLSYNTTVVHIGDERYEAKIIYNNKKFDFAILKIPASHPLPFLRFARETYLNQKVSLLGRYSKNRELFLSKGTINAKGINMSSKDIDWVSQNLGQKRKVDYAIQNGILHSARFFEGLSGCPLLDDAGDVIGMNSGILGNKRRHVFLALELVGFLPIIQQYSSLQIPQTTVDTSDFSVDLNDPLKRLDWVLKGLFHYCCLLGKNQNQVEEIRNCVEKQAKKKIEAQNTQDKSAIQWAWKAFLTEVYAMK
jgi:S1-C subfamily serine protease